MSRIKLAYRLLQGVDLKTKAYWFPYLATKLRRIEETGAAVDTLIAELASDGTRAITESLTIQNKLAAEEEAEKTAAERWTSTAKISESIIPLTLSALGFILAKISQSTLGAIDRRLSSRLFAADYGNEDSGTSKN